MVFKIMNTSKQDGNQSDSEFEEQTPRRVEEPIDTVSLLGEVFQWMIGYSSLESNEIISTHVVLCQTFGEE